MPSSRFSLTLTALTLASLAVIFFAGCQNSRPAAASVSPALSSSAAPITASPRRIVGRVIAVDAAERFAFVELKTSLVVRPDTELITRTDDLRETARLRASSQLRGRTLGATLVNGQPAVGDEVVFELP